MGAAPVEEATHKVVLLIPIAGDALGESGDSRAVRCGGLGPGLTVRTVPRSYEALSPVL